MKKSFNKRRLKHGSLATVMTVGFVAVVILINAIVGMLVQRFPMDIDLTEDNIFELSDQSVDYIKGLDADVTINILMDEESFKGTNPYYRQAYEVIQKYDKYSDRISVHFIDLYTNPDLQQKYPKESIAPGNILVESGPRYQRLTGHDLFNVQTEGGQSYITSSAAEQAMTGAIMNVTNENPPTVAVITGFGTYDVSAFTGILRSNGYVVEDVDLISGDLEGFDMAIIASPTIDFTDAELAKLDTFLDNEGRFQKNLLYFASTAQPKLPNLEEFLAEWGIIVGDGYLYETDPASTYFDPSYTLQNYGDEKYLEKLPTKELPVIIPVARPLSSAFGSSGLSSNRATTTLLSSHDSAVLIPTEVYSDPDSKWDPMKDGEKAAYPTVMACTRTKYDQLDSLVSTVVAFGSIDIVHKNFLSFAAMNNADYVLNVANVLCDKEDGIQIVPKTLGTSSLGINQNQVNTIGGAAQFVLPIIILIIGTVVWMRRRNK